MASYAVVDEAGIVVNVIEYDGISPYTPPAGTTLVQSDIAARGYNYDGTTFTNPNAG